MADDSEQPVGPDIPGWSKAETILVTGPVEEGSLSRRKRRIEGPPPAEPAGATAEVPAPSPSDAE